MEVIVSANHNRRLTHLVLLLPGRLLESDVGTLHEWQFLFHLGPSVRDYAVHPLCSLYRFGV
jgi:hypothetical protein